MDLAKAQIFYIYKVTKVVIIHKNKNIIYANF